MTSTRKRVLRNELEYTMSSNNRQTLIKNRVYLLHNIVPTYILLSQLQADEVLTEDMIETILIEPTTKGKVAALLNILSRRGPKAFSNLIKALVVSGQYYTARFLEDTT